MYGGGGGELCYTLLYGARGEPVIVWLWERTPGGEQRKQEVWDGRSPYKRAGLPSFVSFFSFLSFLTKLDSFLHTPVLLVTIHLFPRNRL